MASVVSLTLLFSATAPVCATDMGMCSAEPVEIQMEASDNQYYLFVEDGNLYITSAIQTQMGSGIGHCSVKNKTFKYSMTKKQAQAALKAINAGDGAVKTLGTLLSTIVPGGVGLATSIVMNFLGGEDAYVRQMNNFVNSGKQTATFTFKTHCVERGNSYGEPMYDYVVDSVQMSY